MHHICGLAHLDIKLENIVIDKYFIPKFIDFAFSDWVGADLTLFRGTEIYMAPEMFYVREEMQKRRAPQSNRKLQKETCSP